MILQILSFLFLFFLSNLFNLLTFPHLIFLIGLGVLLSLWGLIGLGRLSYSPFPKPKKRSRLIKAGAFRYIRHPVYMGLILICLSLLLSRFVFPAMVVFVLFFLVTNTKASLEERFLEEKYPKYKEYKQKTGKFVPFIYL